MNIKVNDNFVTLIREWWGFLILVSIYYMFPSSFYPDFFIVQIWWHEWSSLNPLWCMRYISICWYLKPWFKQIYRCDYGELLIMQRWFINKLLNQFFKTEFWWNNFLKRLHFYANWSYKELSFWSQYSTLTAYEKILWILYLTIWNIIIWDLQEHFFLIIFGLNTFNKLIFMVDGLIYVLTKAYYSIEFSNSSFRKYIYASII